MDVRISVYDCHFESKHKKLFFSASERPRTVLNAFLECMYFDKMTVIYAYMDDVRPY